MNAIPQKPFEADPAIAQGSKAAAEAEAENVRLTIDFEDEDAPEGPIAPAASAHAPARPPGGPAQADQPHENAGRSARISGSASNSGPPEPAGAATGEPSPASAARRRQSPPGAEPNGSVSTAQPAPQTPAQPLAMPPQLAGIEVTLTVEIGSHRLPLKDLLSIDPGQLFALDRMTTEPVSILVNGKPFAHGEIVAIGDRFGVRLLDIVQSEAS